MSIRSIGFCAAVAIASLAVLPASALAGPENVAFGDERGILEEGTFVEALGTTQLDTRGNIIYTCEESEVNGEYHSGAELSGAEGRFETSSGDCTSGMAGLEARVKNVKVGPMTFWADRAISNRVGFAELPISLTLDARVLGTVTASCSYSGVLQLQYHFNTDLQTGSGMTVLATSILAAGGNCTGDLKITGELALTESGHPIRIAP